MMNTQEDSFADYSGSMMKELGDGSVRGAVRIVEGAYREPCPLLQTDFLDKKYGAVFLFRLKKWTRARWLRCACSATTCRGAIGDAELS